VEPRADHVSGRLSPAKWRLVTELLGTGLRGKPCRPCGSNLKVEVMGRVRYPDGYIIPDLVD